MNSDKNRCESLNLYRLIKQYIDARRAKGNPCTRFFFSVRYGKNMDLSEYFKRKPLGENTCKSVVKYVCASLGIRKQGQAAYMTTHGLRATMISLLISAGYSDAAVVLRSGRRYLNSLQCYHNLRGRHGTNQLCAAFGSKLG